MDELRKRAIITCYQAQRSVGHKHLQAVLNVASLENVPFDEVAQMLKETNGANSV
jgi:hypothetical protein